VHNPCFYSTFNVTLESLYSTVTFLLDGKFNEVFDIQLGGDLETQNKKLWCKTYTRLYATKLEQDTSNMCVWMDFGGGDRAPARGPRFGLIVLVIWMTHNNSIHQIPLSLICWKISEIHLLFT
jgi:hypothetical protein